MSVLEAGHRATAGHRAIARDKGTTGCPGVILINVLLKLFGRAEDDWWGRSHFCHNKQTEWICHLSLVGLTG